MKAYTCIRGALRTGSFGFLVLCSLLIVSQVSVSAQMIEDYADQRKLALRLYNENNFAAARLVLETLAAANPKDREVLEALGLVLIGTASGSKDVAARQSARARGRSFLVRAQELGADSLLLREALQTVPVDGGNESIFSTRKAVDDAMREGEAAFAANQTSKAIEAYGRALALDPQLYEAALFIGDAYFKSKEMDKACEWFARAVVIDPNRETAYRYWGDALTEQGKSSAARDVFVEAFLAEPYNRLARAGLLQWAQKNQILLAHPRIDIPTSISAGKNGNVNVTLDSSLAGNGGENGSSAWVIYGLARAGWQTSKGKLGEKYVKQFPTSATYRHSLAEEMDALGLVLISVKQQEKDSKIKKLDPSLANLKDLDQRGLLAAYILLAMPDSGIAEDYLAYRKSNKEKLRKYMNEIVLTGGGN
jgi:tetratricopeptide (TPR) repeat protein